MYLDVKERPCCNLMPNEKRKRIFTDSDFGASLACLVARGYYYSNVTARRKILHQLILGNDLYYLKQFFMDAHDFELGFNFALRKNCTSKLAK